jgi:hypothetical protein
MRKSLQESKINRPTFNGLSLYTKTYTFLYSDCIAFKLNIHYLASYGPNKI